MVGRLPAEQRVVQRTGHLQRSTRSCDRHHGGTGSDGDSQGHREKRVAGISPE